MNQAYRFDFDSLEDDEVKKSTPAKDIEKPHQYGQSGPVRNICFVEATGRQTFLNYGYLVAGVFDVEENEITLEFTTHTVKLKGLFLQKLYDDLMHQVTMRITYADARYNELLTGDAYVVNVVDLQKNGL